MFHFTFVAMKFSWLLSFCACATIVFTACEKEISIPLIESEPKLVVEGSIASDQQPFVFLTNTIGFFDKISSENITFVNDADVWVTDLTVNKKIKLTPLTDSSGQFFPSSVTIYTILPGDPFYADFQTGMFGHFYQLDIRYNEEDYVSVAKIPNAPNFDSLYFEQELQFTDTLLFGLKGSLADPDTAGNYYKYFTKRNGNGWNDIDYIEPFSSRFDDAFFNGKTIPADLFIGFNDREPDENEFISKSSYSSVGDTISVRLSSMDARVYRFWKTLDFAEGSIGNPFASPIQVQSNISNGAFGVWAGYGNKYKTIINKP